MAWGVEKARKCSASDGEGVGRHFAISNDCLRREKGA